MDSRRNLPADCSESLVESTKPDVKFQEGPQSKRLGREALANIETG